MLNRRHLRIKVLQSLYGFYQSEGTVLIEAEKQMLESLEKIFDLYLYFLLTFSELKREAEFRFEENKKKLLPTEEDLNPNKKWIENSVTLILESNSELQSSSGKRKVNWIGEDNRVMFRKMHTQIRKSETFYAYMNNDQSGFEEDKAFAISIFKEEIANSPLIHDFLEEKSIHWMDDIDLVCSMVIKTIKTFQSNTENRIMSLYKDKDDELEFVTRLLNMTVNFDKDNELIIDELTSNWELDRIAKMDIILMKMAITELQIFSNIPTKVTLNEYIEISKFYSTPKSNSFINGVLDKGIVRLEKEGKINKVGRGLKN
jgi:N utilization substance protein B